ncbi:MAG: hypothetical protein M1812_004029 [Candelaria pacifica]|nr:MAG: hypothetical protein M1812_004029 [Candelaria pacifica]
MSLQEQSFPILNLLVELQIYLLSDVYLLNSSFKLVNKHYRLMLHRYETTICARIIKEFYAFEAKCFPPGDFSRGYRDAYYAIHNEAYTESCQANHLTFGRFTYEYVDFLQNRSHTVENFTQEITKAQALDGPDLYKNFLVLWCLTAGASWSSSMRAFAKLPKHTQLSFNEFLDDLAERWSRLLAPDLACAFLGHNEYSQDHVNYEDVWLAMNVSV